MDNNGHVYTRQYHLTMQGKIKIKPTWQTSRKMHLRDNIYFTLYHQKMTEPIKRNTSLKYHQQCEKRQWDSICWSLVFWSTVRRKKPTTVRNAQLPQPDIAAYDCWGNQGTSHLLFFHKRKEKKKEYCNTQSYSDVLPEDDMHDLKGIHCGFEN